ncbi:IclR family transcriptional regulator domain-containing protein [Galactobacter valiniphilus]|uniref:IclR family transcriptional regulator domain-containing protein n=1 Tax=Galactobacter valiniphilus TaxID=2676122 RepID=UPI00373571F0
MSTASPQPGAAAPGEGAATADSSLFVQSLARGLAVMAAFDAEHRELTLSQAAARAGLSRASARRLLHTLVELGYASTDGSSFALTPSVLRFGWAYLSGQPFAELARPVLQRLSDALGESASAAELDGTEVVYVQRVETKRIMRVDIRLGTRFPAAWTSMGRVLLAGTEPSAWPALVEASLPAAPPSARVIEAGALIALLEDVRERGYCIIDQELEPGLRSVAVPVRGPSGRVEHALNVSLRSAQDESAERAGERVVPALLAAAAELEAALGLS